MERREIDGEKERTETGTDRYIKKTKNQRFLFHLFFFTLFLGPTFETTNMK